jgi:Cation/multidrug efflux pump
MKRINLSEWALSHQVLMVFFMVLVVVAGVRSYFQLGQNEDPEFTVKTMVVRAYLPGATIEETMLQLTDRIEKKLQETPSLDYLKSYTLPGETTIFIELLSGTPKKDVPDIWYQVRKKVGDIRQDMPSETQGPFFDDEFGDTYGIIYAFTADGFTHRELKDYVEDIRSELLHVALCSGLGQYHAV